MLYFTHAKGRKFLIARDQIELVLHVDDAAVVSADATDDSFHEDTVSIISLKTPDHSTWVIPIRETVDEVADDLLGA